MIISEKTVAVAKRMCFGMWIVAVLIFAATLSIYSVYGWTPVYIARAIGEGTFQGIVGLCLLMFPGGNDRD